MAATMKTPRPKQRDRTSVDSERADVREGSPLPVGTQKSGKGINFALFSRHATGVQLELFDHPEDPAPARVIDLDPARHRTGDVWHVSVVHRAPGTEGK
jgi:isoamylase